MPTYKNPGLLEFDAVIQRTDGGGSFVAFPYDARELFGVGNLIPVKMTFDGLPYRGSLANMGGGSLMCLILKSIREQLGKDRGDTVHVTVELDDGARELEIPDDLVAALTANPAAKELFDALAYSHRREYVRWIASAKRPETRATRIAKTITMVQDKQKLK